MSVRSMTAEAFTALGNWRTTIGAVMTMQVVGRFKSNPFGLLLTLAEPFLLLLMIMLLRVVFKQRVPSFGDSEVVFLSSGILPYYTFVRMSSRTRSNTGFDAGRRPPRVTSTDLLVGTLAADVSLFFVVIITWFAILAFFGLDEAVPYSVTTCAAALVCLASLGIGMGLISSAIALRFPLWNFFYGFVARMLIFLAGVFYIVDLMRYDIRENVALNPLAHGIVMFRLGLYGNYPSLILDPMYLVQWAGAMLFLGLIAHRGSLRYG